jgi:tetratricopeptide (TPR) repeat protein
VEHEWTPGKEAVVALLTFHFSTFHIQRDPVPIDRDATLKRAEKLLRQGKLDGAIQEYVRLVEEHPRDWNAMNALGDLYARAGRAERAVAQFTRIADHLHDEGFFPRAAALYKKALKTQGDHEPTLLRLGEMAVRQGLAADARMYLNHVARLRAARGDERGANECLVALGGLPDPDLKLAAGRAAAALGDRVRATDLFLEAAQVFENDGRPAEELEALIAAVEADDTDLRLRARVALQCQAVGQVDRARLFLTRDTAADDPDLLLALARLELDAGSHDAGRLAISRLLMIAPQRTPDVLRVCDDLVAAGNRDAAFACVDSLSEMALLGGDADAAIGALQSLLQHGPHVPALMKLVEIAVDTDRGDLMTDVQEQLADAYLEAGRGGEARVIAEDLVARDPSRGENVNRLRRALIQVGASDVESIIASHLEPPGAREEAIPDFDLPDTPSVESEEAALPPSADKDARVLDEDVTLRAVLASGDDLTLPDNLTAHQEIVIDDPLPESSPDVSGSVLASPTMADGPDALQATDVGEEQQTGEMQAGPVEIDLSDVLAELASLSPVFTPPPAAPELPPTVLEERPLKTPAAGPPDLDAVFQQMRSRVREHRGTAPAALLERGLRLLDEGRLPEAMADLEAAARAPMLRFPAASALGRLHASRNELAAAVEWLERAAEAPPPSDDDSLAVLYELADVLERMGETARALAVLLEIDADRASYRDVPARIQQLTRAQVGSPDR